MRTLLSTACVLKDDFTLTMKVQVQVFTWPQPQSSDEASSCCKDRFLVPVGCSGSCCGDSFDSCCCGRRGGAAADLAPGPAVAGCELGCAELDAWLAPGRGCA